MTGRRARGERGSIAPAVPIIALVLLLLGGLGIDGSRQLNARGEAVAFAEEAARAGAQAIDVNASDLRLDDAMVRDRVRTYCEDVAKRGEAECHFVRIEPVSKDDPRMLVVVTEASLSIKPSLLGIVHPGNLPAKATARARPYEGVTKADK